MTLSIRFSFFLDFFYRDHDSLLVKDDMGFAKILNFQALISYQISTISWSQIHRRPAVTASFSSSFFSAPFSPTLISRYPSEPVVNIDNEPFLPQAPDKSCKLPVFVDLIPFFGCVLQEIRNLHNEQLMGIRREEEMEMSDDDMEDTLDSKDSEDSGTTCILLIAVWICQSERFMPSWG